MGTNTGTDAGTDMGTDTGPWPGTLWAARVGGETISAAMGCRMRPQSGRAALPLCPSTQGWWHRDRRCRCWEAVGDPKTGLCPRCQDQREVTALPAASGAAIELTLVA